MAHQGHVALFQGHGGPVAGDFNPQDAAEYSSGVSVSYGVEIPCNRATVALKEGDVALVGQYSGPRLPEGATSLPEGAAIKWLVVGVNAPALEGQDND